MAFKDNIGKLCFHWLVGFFFFTNSQVLSHHVRFMDYMTSFDLVKNQIFRDIVHHEIPLNNFLQCPSWSLFPPFYRAKPCNLLFLLVLPQLMSHQYLLKQFFCHWKLTLFNNQYKLSFIPNKQKHIEVKVTSQANVCQTMHISIIKKAKVYVTVTW